MALAGRSIGGRYRLLETIGEGPTTVAVRAVDDIMGREVVVKALRPQFALEPAYVDAFRRETRRAATLLDPQLGTIVDSGVDDMAGHYVVANHEGISLDALLRRDGKVTVALGGIVGVSIARALAAIHATGAVHGAIHPRNILMDSIGWFRLTDLGIGRVRSIADPRAWRASPILAPYVSPEQVRGDRIGTGADIFSLGVVLYEALTGRLPYEGRSLDELALERLRVRPAPMRALDPAIPAALDAAVMRALELQPGDRHASAAAFESALGAFDGRPAGPRHPPARIRVSQTARGAAGLGAAAGGVGVAGGVGAAGVAVAAGAPDIPDATIVADVPAQAPSGMPDTAAMAADPAHPATAERAGPTGRPEAPVFAPAPTGPPTVTTRPRRRDRSRGAPPLALAAIAGLAVLSVVFGIALGTMALGERRAGVLAATAVPSRTDREVGLVPPTDVGGPSLSPATGASPAATSAPTRRPTAEPTPRPTPRPTARPTPRPTPQPTTAPTARPSAAPTVVAAANDPLSTLGPVRTVRRFYDLVERHEFEAAAAMWTDEMRRRYPPGGYIEGRFAPTTRIDIDRIELVRRAGGTAVVAVALTEYRSSGPSPRRFVGSWDLVRVGDRWLLADPDF